MLNFLKKIVSPPSPATEPVAAPPAPAPVDPYMLGLRDAVLSGWFNQETDELFSGFPISAEDTVLDVGCGPGWASFDLAQIGDFRRVLEAGQAEGFVRGNVQGFGDVVEPLVEQPTPTVFDVNQQVAGDTGGQGQLFLGLLEVVLHRLRLLHEAGELSFVEHAWVSLWSKGMEKKEAGVRPA